MPRVCVSVRNQFLRLLPLFIPLSHILSLRKWPFVEQTSWCCKIRPAPWPWTHWHMHTRWRKWVLKSLAGGDSVQYSFICWLKSLLKMFKWSAVCHLTNESCPHHKRKERGTINWKQVTTFSRYILVWKLCPCKSPQSCLNRYPVHVWFTSDMDHNPIWRYLISCAFFLLMYSFYRFNL